MCIRYLDLLSPDDFLPTTFVRAVRLLRLFKADEYVGAFTLLGNVWNNTKVGARCKQISFLFSPSFLLLQCESLELKRQRFASSLSQGHVLRHGLGGVCNVGFLERAYVLH